MKDLLPILIGWSLIGQTLAGLADYDAAIAADDVALPGGSLVKLTTPVILDGTRGVPFDFGDTFKDKTIEFIISGLQDPTGSVLAVGANDTFELRFDQWKDTGRLGFTHLGNKDYVSTIPTPAAPTHVTFRWDEISNTADVMNMEIYINGELRQTIHAPGFKMPGDSGFLGARNATGSAAMTGRIERLTAYVGALDPALIRRHAHAFLSQPYQTTHDPVAIIYDAADGDPDPASQGWDPDEITMPGEDTNGDGVLDGNANVGPVEGPAWQVYDRRSETGLDGPWYQHEITPTELTAMFENGWTFETTVRAVGVDRTTSSFIGWQFRKSQDPGYGIAAHAARMGFHIYEAPNNAFAVSPTFRDAVILDPNSADEPHTIRAVGVPRSPVFEWFVDDVSQGYLDLRDFPYGYSEAIFFGANSSASMGDGADWFDISLSSKANIDIPPYLDAIARESELHGESLVGNGVNAATGSLQQAFNLLSVQGVRAVDFPITYDSQLTARPGAMGYGWSHVFEARLQCYADDRVVIHWDANRLSEFTYVETNARQRYFKGADEDVQYAELVENAIGSPLTFPWGTWRLTLLDGTVFGFDPSDGRLIYVANSARQGFDLEYDDTGRLVRVQEKFTDAYLDLGYNDRGLLSTVSDPMERQVLLDYDEEWRLEAIPSPVMDDEAPERKTYFTYNGYRITRADDLLGDPLFSCTYDAQGRVLSQDDGREDTGATGFTYFDIATNDNKLTFIQDAMGQVYQFIHDPKFRLIEVLDPRGTVATYTYDEMGNRLTATNARGFTTRFEYHANGSLRLMEDPAGNQTTFDYDIGSGVNFVSKITDALDRSTHLQYIDKRMIAVTDHLGHQDRKSYSPDTGQLLGVALADSADVNFDLRRGRIVGSTHPGDTAGTAAKKSADYDEAGRQIQSWSRSGYKTEYAYNSSSDLISETDPDGFTKTIAYDHRGRRTEVTDKRGNTTTYAYDGNDNLIAVTDALGGVTAYEYDVLDRRVSMTNTLGQTTQYRYDAVGQRIAVIDSLGRMTRTEYDRNGNVKAQFNRQGVRVVAFTYDERDLMTHAVDAYGQEMTVTYDAAGRRATSTDTKGRITTYHYDALDRPTGVTDPLGRRSMVTYESDDVVDTITAPGTSAINFDYTRANRLRTFYLANGDEVRYRYDPDDRLSYFDTGERFQEFDYDALGRLLHDDIPFSAGTPQDFDRRYRYDANGNLTHVESKPVDWDDGYMPRNTRTYDALNRLTSYTDENGNTLTYGYDALGNLTSLGYPDGWMVHYTYDEANRLTTVTDGDGRLTRYTYDRRDLITRIDLPNGSSRQMSYDSGNRILHREDLDASGHLIVAYHYSYDSEGQLLAEAVTPEPPSALPEAHRMRYNSQNQLIELDGETIVYDREGSIRNGPAKYGLGLLRYNSRGRLKQTDSLGYDYDEEDRLIGWGATSFVLSPHGAMSQVLTMTEGDGSLTRFVYGVGLIYEEKAGETLTHHFDHRGSSVAFSDGSGVTVGRVAYSPYGKMTSTEGARSSLFLYNALYGVLTSPDGLNYMRFRWYWPEVGRFLTADAHFGSALHIATMNRYGFAGGNPIAHIDPQGEFINFVAGAIGAGIGAVIGAGSELIGSAIKGEAVDWGSVGAAALGGAVAGAITGVTAGLGTIAGGLVATGAGGLGGLTQNLVNAGIKGEAVGLTSLLEDVAWGAGGGALGFGLAKGGGKLLGKSGKASSTAIKRQGVRSFDDLIRAENAVRKIAETTAKRAARLEAVVDAVTDLGVSVSLNVVRPIAEDFLGGTARAGGSGVNPHGTIAIFRQGASNVNGNRNGAYGEHRHYKLFTRALTLAGRPVPNNPSNILTSF